MIIAISGKTGVGKTTFANMLAPTIKAEVMSFASSLKDEVSHVFGLNRELLDTQKGKAKTIKLTRKQQHLLGVAEPPRTWTIREILQAYGQYRRQADPDYWSNLLAARIGNGNVIIDDMRYLNELGMVESHPLHRLKMFVRIDPYPGWKPGQHSQHRSETELDECDKWDIIIRNPKFGGLSKYSRQLSEIILELHNE